MRIASADGDGDQAAAPDAAVRGIERDPARPGEVDLRPGVRRVRLRIDVVAPEATDEQLAKLGEKTERYCTVAQTLMRPPPLSVELFRA